MNLFRLLLLLCQHFIHVNRYSRMRGENIIRNYTATHNGIIDSPHGRHFRVSKIYLGRNVMYLRLVYKNKSTATAHDTHTYILLYILFKRRKQLFVVCQFWLSLSHHVHLRHNIKLINLIFCFSS